MSGETKQTYFQKLKARAVAANPIPDRPMTMPLTGLVVTVLIICLGIYDLVMVVKKGTGSSVSDFLIRAGVKSNVVLFAFAFVMGHLFGKMTPEGNTPTDNWWLVICGVLFGMGVGYGIANLLQKKPKPQPAE